MSLDLRDISVRFGRVRVLEGITAGLAAGEVTALIGPNGAGKSTLLRAAAGLLPASGAVLLDGRAAAPDARRAAVAYMPQDTSAVSSLTLLEVVLLGRLRSLGLRLPAGLVAEAETELSRFGLAALADRTLDAVSGGQRQLVYLAQALFRRPRVLLLDEPTAALDLRHQLVVLDTVRRTARQHGVVVAAAMHDLSLAARFADTVLCLCGGRLDATGTPSEVLSPERLRRVYGVEAELLADSDGRPHVSPLRAV